MTLKPLILIVTLICMSGDKACLSGCFSFHNKYDRYQLVFKKNHRFEQKNSSCTWSYLAKGYWKLDHDTLTLIPEKIYSYHGTRRAVDTTSYNYDLFYQNNTGLMVSSDTIYLLYRRKRNGEVIRKIVLTRKKTG